MRIRLINPNTTQSMTDTIGRSALTVAGPLTRVEAVSPSMGPASIESHYEEALAVPGILEQVLDGEQAGVDAYVIACFGDPGLDAAREIATGPVLGIAEAAMHAAAMLGRTFGIVTTLGRTTGGPVNWCSATGSPTCARPSGRARSRYSRSTTRPRTRATSSWTSASGCSTPGADAVVLGCAGMADFCHWVSDRIGAPVVDGVSAATVLAESLVRLGLATGKRGEYARPPLKPMAGLLAPFELGAVALR